MQARLLRLLRETTPEQTTAIVTGFVDGTDDVLAGEVVWTSADAFVHWEMFSEAALMNDTEHAVDRWSSAEDSTDDLNVDATSVIAAVEEFGREYASASSLDHATAIRALFARHLGRAFSKWQVRFESQWAQDPARYEAALARAGAQNASGLGIERYTFWSHTAGALPSQTLAWHYHPIHFLLALGSHTDAFVGTVVVAAYNEEGVEPSGEVAVVSVDGSYETLYGTLASGHVTFPRVPPGRARVELDLGRNDVEQAVKEVLVPAGTALQVVFGNVRNPNAIMWRAP